MEIADFTGLLTPQGREALDAAMESDVSERALLSTTARLRARYPAELVGAALVQVRLRARAEAKFGGDAARMYFTPHGLEQSTRAAVAAYRAARFAEFAGTGGAVLELCCGIGADLLFRARAGVPGTGVDLDPLTVAVASANLAAFGVDGIARARVGDALEQDPAGYAAVFADPGRRTARGRVFDPRSYEPPLDALLELASRAPAGCVKVAPGIPYEAVPEDAHTEWISVDGDVKEAAIWLGGLAERAGGPARRATLLKDGGTHSLVTGPEPAVPEIRPWGRYLYEPDGAVVRAHLVAEVAALVGGGLADPRIAYITSDSLEETPFAGAYEIREVLPFSVKRLKAALRAQKAGSLTLKKRGFAADLDRLYRDLRPACSGGSGEAVVVLTRVGDSPFALLCAKH